MSGHFEVFTDDNVQYRFRLVAPDGHTLAESGPFEDKKTLAANIFEVRECAGTGLVEDLSTGVAQGQYRPALSAAQNGGDSGSSSRPSTITLAWPPPVGMPAKETRTPPTAAIDDVEVTRRLVNLVGKARQQIKHPQGNVDCGVTVYGSKSKVVSVNGGGLAESFDNLQSRLAPGPCQGPQATRRPILMADLSADRRWPNLAHAAVGLGIRSLLVVPLTIGNRGSAVLTVCADRPNELTTGDLENLERFANTEGPGLQPAVQIAILNQTIQDLHSAIAHRTAISLAMGIIMAQNRCTQDTAFDILRRTSTTRNIKLRDIASSIVSSVSGQKAPSTHFEP